MALRATAACLLAASAAAANMNGKYVVASGGELAPEFEDDYEARGMEYFDVWAGA